MCRSIAPSIPVLIGILSASCAGDGAAPADLPPVAVVRGPMVALLGGTPEAPVPAEVTLDGSASFDPDGPPDPLAFTWGLVHAPDGFNGVIPPAEDILVLRLDRPGTYLFRLVVRSGGQGSPPAYAGVSVLPPPRSQVANTPPVPRIRVEPDHPLLGTEVTLDGSASEDPDPGDGIEGFHWVLRDPTATERSLGREATASFLPTRIGTYQVTLTVWDRRGTRSTASQPVEVAECLSPGEEVCNGEDDDCDGWIDEDFDSDGDGVTVCMGDCDDAAPDTHPGATEYCDGRDNDCDGMLDEGFDADGDGFSQCAGDCRDDDPTVHPGAAEACNQADDDCDGRTDEDFDEDGDGVTTCRGDCDDYNPAIRPGIQDPCDGKDNDCDGLDGVDRDGDGFTNCQEQCDGDATRNPGREETPGNGVDENCDGRDAPPICPDLDGDGYCGRTPGCDPDPAPAQGRPYPCPPEPDCNDRLPDIHPGAEEPCDRVDNNCDGHVDEGHDEDGDGFLRRAGEGEGACGGDCDDRDPSSHPGAAEVCDGKDNNCNNRVDEGFDTNRNGIPDCLE